MLLGFLQAQAYSLPAPAEPAAVSFSHSGGFYPEPVKLVLSSTPDSKIYYTVDGSTPGSHTTLYRGPILITNTAVIRAVAYTGKKRSDFQTHTFFIQEPESQLAVVSVAVTPRVLFDPDGGMFMAGSLASDSLWFRPGANFWSRKEVPVQVELFEPDGKCVYNRQTGFRLFGGMSRLSPQKSFALVARKQYGKARFDYALFGEDNPKDFKYLVLRNSGSDFGKSHFRDALMHELVKDWDLESQAYRPAHVYINGRYWGIYNIREKINRYFLEDHQDVNRDSLDLLEHKDLLRRGSRSHYTQLLRFIQKNDLSDPRNYAYVCSQMEVENFMDYQIAQIYCDNQDAGRNIKFWRPRTANGRWRWILYDTDWGFGLHDAQAYKNNSLAFHTAPNGPAWPNPPWSTFLLRKLLENPDFRRQFVTRFADHLNTSFHPDRVNTAVEAIYQALAPEMDRHLNRWRIPGNKWKDQVDIIRNFALERPEHVRMHLMEMFDTGAQVPVSLTASNGGAIWVNEHLNIEAAGLNGFYFERMPLKITAIPRNGFRFSHWEGLDNSGKQAPRTLVIYLQKQKPVHLKAVFVPFKHPLSEQVVINEISPNYKKASDWVELFNTTKEPVDVSGWILADAGHEFRLPPNSIIQPRDYMIICQDAGRFSEAFPKAYNVIGGLSFGLNRRAETLSLYTGQGASVDSAGYALTPSDTSFTWSLLLPGLDNADPSNWQRITGIGTPNAANPYYLQSTVRVSQVYWVRIGMLLGILVVGILAMPWPAGLRLRWWSAVRHILPVRFRK